MKQKNLLLILLPLVVIYLFDGQILGLNTVLFSVLLISLSAVFHPKTLKSRFWIIASTASLILSTAHLFTGNPWALNMCLLSWIIVIGACARKGQSFIMSVTNGIFSFLLGGFHKIMYKLSNPSESEKDTDSAKKRYLPAIVSTIIALTFLSLYAYSNPVIEHFLINIEWPSFEPSAIFYAGIGLMVAQTLVKPIILGRLTIQDQKTKLSLNQNDYSIAYQEGKLDLEMKTGTITLALLNLMIAAYIITDLYVFSKGHLPAGVTYTSYVHQGVGSLILSILLAIGIICYLFRGATNFAPNTEKIKRLAIGWVALNAGLALTTAYKNWLYIHNYGLTYKRIGVFVFLCLTLAGLLTTLIKVQRKRSLAYLLRTNTSIAYLSLCLFALPPWDALIVQHNIQKPNYQDTDYLLSLSENGLLELKKASDANPQLLLGYKKNILWQKLQNRKIEIEKSRWVSWSNSNKHILEATADNQAP
ncbi:hypothetical protein FUAX_10670 [Fulvitalea axinellae]|uniref:DUF4173 domain-containing protein n=1 Tax=Fulvitalea axinellae TaxID=1182444 RepID=A0AAU9DCR0_9BACT|nr:hypothetical protein FUAX_10670 [Fulvitalea axinellae]